MIDDCLEGDKTDSSLLEDGDALTSGSKVGLLEALGDWPAKET